MIDIQNLIFGYSRKRLLFNQLNLALPEGYIYGLLGKNGAGKSSLLKNIAGLLYPLSGSCQIHGLEAKDRHPAFLQKIFFISEEFYVPSIPIRKFKNIYAPFYPNFDSQQFHAYLQEFEIDESQNLTQLSYGQKKKVLISFGLATNTRVLILDEPTNGLDIPSKAQFRKIVSSAVHAQRTILISTHQVRDLENLINPILILDNSEILLHASAEEITHKLSFQTVSQLSEARQPLYAEASPNGYAIVTENRTQQASRLDLELLFQAVLTNREQIRSLFPSPTLATTH